MMNYLSTTGGSPPVGFDQAVLQGFAADGGLLVPERITTVPKQQLLGWRELGYLELAAEILGCYIDPSIVPKQDLISLLSRSFSSFEQADPPLVSPLADPSRWVMELFHGPTLSFKDVAMGFLINLMDYFLERKGQRLSLLLATTGDTGPAAAYAAAGRKRISCWPLYPASMISPEQELQMTSIAAANIMPVEVSGCRNGGDDLDLVVARLFSDEKQRRRLNLSSVNSINIGRVLMQTVHYFYGYLRVAETVGDHLVFSVPAGAFGNLCAGELARAMGLPVSFICATNKNKTLHRIFSEGTLALARLQTSLSSAIDIVVPYNFWRFLYLRCGADARLVSRAMQEFSSSGVVNFEAELHQRLSQGFVSTPVSDQQTLETIRRYFAASGYLVDPHGAVALSGVETCRHHFAESTRFISLATAHPAKFPAVIKEALTPSAELPAAAFHDSLERARRAKSKKLCCTSAELEHLLLTELEKELA
jgi:threonine synthase